MLTPTSLAEVQDAVKSLDRIHTIGAGTKPALSKNATLSMTGVSGVLEYNPSEYTFTALAGTPLSEVQAMLAKHNQLMPFDPPLVEAGATLGGTVAAGLSGPGRYRYGGVRDFFLGVRMVTTAGRVVFGGGKVVKNAAGFDIPKFNVGALGRFGVMVELTFKVFPKPESWTTVCAQYDDMTQAVAGLNRVAVSPTESTCLDLTDDNRLLVRLGGIPDAQAARAARVSEICQTNPIATASDVKVTTLSGDDEEQEWRSAREFLWVPGDHSLVKIPVLPEQIMKLDDHLNSLGVAIPRRYSVGGNVAWIGLPNQFGNEQLGVLSELLNRNILVLRGDLNPLTTSNVGAKFEERLNGVFASLAPSSD
jgi:glycolate oxidase FAD binding subunit